MKTLIVFREGHSGRFLQAIIQDMPPDVAAYRLDDYRVRGFNQWVTGTHEVDLSNQQKSHDLVLRILPKHNIYNAIYNVFTKKLLLEEYSEFNLSDWNKNLTFWYDKCFYLIKEYYALIHNDIADNLYPNTVNFDQLTDRDYIAHIIQKYYNTNLTNNQQNLIKDYSKLQLSVSLSDNDQTSMKEIIEPISDQMLHDNPWFSAYCIFKFEKNNNFSESARLWSIDNITEPFTQRKLLEIATQY